MAKTDNAIREIPLHPTAQAIVAARLAGIADNKQPEAPLFPDLPVGGPDKKRSWKFSPKYSEWRQSILGVSREVDFHSLRRCFATFWEHAQANGGAACTDLVRKDVMGHARQDVTAGYVGRNLGWDTYTRGIEAMVALGLPDEVRRQALEDTKDSRPPVSQKWGKRSHN